MDGIEKITGRIAADTEAEIASIQAEARRQADEITARYEAQAKREAAITALGALIRRSLHIDARCYPASDAPIARVAVAGGAYGEGYALAAQSGAQAFVVGEIRHHELLDAYARGLTVYDAGHFPTELPGVMSLYERFLADATCAGWPVKAHLHFQPPYAGALLAP